MPAANERRRMVAVKGHPGIYHKSGHYLVRWRHNGRQVSKSFRTLTEAKQHKALTAAAPTAPTSGQPFARYADNWIDSYTGRTASGVSEVTRDSYRDALDRFAKNHFGTVPLDRIDAPALKAFIAHLASKGLAPASVRRAYAPVRALLATAYEDGLIASNPAVGVRVIVKDTRPNTQTQTQRLTAAQTEALLAEIPAEHADLVYLVASTGARISEALNAVYSGLGTDPELGPVLRFPKSKTAAGLQPVPLTPETARMLTRRRAEADATDEDLIFPNGAGNPYDRRAWTRRVFKPAATRAGVPWASPHMLRHGVATLMAEQGYEAHDIARTLRHADGGALAQRTYMHPRARRVDFLDDMLGGREAAR